MEARYDHLVHEKELQQRWQELKTYQFSPEKQGEVFSVDTPPPTVSGSLHIGHIFSYTHQDIIARFKRMRGHNVFYPMGYDDNGLPTERFVEKKNGVKGHKMSRSAFIEMCLKETHDVEKMFEALWKKMGFSIDWEHTYSTISPTARRVSQHSFLELYRKNKVYRKAEPSLYCATCRTSVAQAELDSVELPSTFNTIIFKGEKGDVLSVATTRPELLPACAALLYHPDDARFQHLAGTTATVPVLGNSVPLLADATVQMDKGTGLVMCCTFGDQTDIQWTQTHNLPIKQIINRDGTWAENAGPLAGLDVTAARKKIIELLKEAALLTEQKPLVHHVNTHERCKQPIEYLNLNQWFVRILEHKKDFIEMGNQIAWYPAYMQARYNDWVEHLSWDWGISRQRFFGIPFPVWHCGDCAEVLLAEPEQLPIDPQETAYGKTCSACGSSNIIPDTDVMDTWNTSSLTPQILTNWPNKGPVAMPLSMRPQAHDIIRTWAFDTIVKAYFHNGSIPWKDIVISGHVLAGKEKISKSKENSVMDPERLLATYPADAIRFWTAHGRLGTDTAFSEPQLKIGQRLITKLWNAFLFTRTHVADYTPRANMAVTDPINAWLLTEAQRTLEAYIRDFDGYEYTAALERVEKFFWQTFCDNYLELVKDQFNNPQLYAADVVESTKFALYEAGRIILQMYAPFVPHITEAIFMACYKQHEKVDSIHALVFDEARLKSYINDSATVLSESILELVAQVRRLKSEQHVSLKTNLECLYIHGNETRFNEINALLMPHLKGVTRALEVRYEGAPLAGSTLTQEGSESWLAHVHLA